VSIQVVTVASRIPDAREPYYKYQTYIDSLARFGVTPTILGMGEPWGGLMTKPRRLRQWLRAGNCKTDTLIVCDAFDVVFTAPPDEVEKKYRDLWPELPIVFNAERGIFPRGELAHKFDDVPGPWKYLNSGFMIGPPDKILALLESMWLDDIHDDTKAADDLHGGAGAHINPNDQGHFLYSYAAQVVPIELDHGCELCQTLSACTIEDFDLTRANILNVVKQTTPLVFHFNGAKELLMPTFLKHWGLS
jgi:hypothetical protein